MQDMAIGFISTNVLLVPVVIYNHSHHLIYYMHLCKIVIIIILDVYIWYSMLFDDHLFLHGGHIKLKVGQNIGLNKCHWYIMFGHTIIDP